MASLDIHGENGVYQQQTTYALKSKSVLQMHIPMIWISKFTDLVNSKKNSIFWEKRLSTKVPLMIFWK